MADVKVTKDLENKTLVIEYTANASKEKVWRAYADKDWFERWWGPEGWRTTVKEFDFRPGGRIHYDMHCIDKNQGEWYDQHSWGLMDIQSVEEGSRFSYVDYFSDENGTLNHEMPALTVTNEFIDEGGTTRIVSRSLAENAEQIEQLIAMGMIEGFTSQLHRLDALLEVQ
jgi:uncharacterized protein YndB with AHSA1/START domain